jgi:hypothetical protein
MILRAAGIGMAAAALAGGDARGQTGPPVGFKFCAYDDPGQGFTQKPPQGAGTAVYGRRMSCKAAKRNYRKTDWMTSPKAKRAGYRCRQTVEDYEFAEYRCFKRGNRRRAFAWQTGS